MRSHQVQVLEDLDEESAKLYKKATDLTHKSQVRSGTSSGRLEAIDYFNSVIKSYPNFVRGINERGVCYSLLNKRTLALQDFNQVISLLEADYLSRDIIRDCREGRVSEYNIDTPKILEHLAATYWNLAVYYSEVKNKPATMRNILNSVAYCPQYATERLKNDLLFKKLLKENLFIHAPTIVDQINKDENWDQVLEFLLELNDKLNANPMLTTEKLVTQSNYSKSVLFADAKLDNAEKKDSLDHKGRKKLKML